MKLVAALTGNLDQMLADEVRIAEQAVTHSIREATDGLKTELRSQITGAGLGQRLANTWRGEVYPKGQLSIKAAGLVYSRAPVIVGAHDQGATIRSKDGFWLAIPLPAAGKGPRGKRMTPAFGKSSGASACASSTAEANRRCSSQKTSVPAKANAAVSRPPHKKPKPLAEGW